MAETGRRTCLLVLPKRFYSFARTFSRTLEGMGYSVTVANEEYPENPLGIILSKLDTGIGRWWTRRTFHQRFLDGKRWDLVAIFKGRGIGERLAQDFKQHALRVVGYHFDSLAYDPATERWAAAADRVTTFDYLDAERKQWPLVELFSASATPSPLPPIRYRITAILRNHSDRLAYVDRVLSALGTEGSFVYLFEKDVGTFLVNALRSPRLYWKWRRHIHRTPLAYERYVDVLASSDFTLDYAHPKQSGATIRSFEALAMSVKLISNNAEMVRSPHFDDDNLIVFGRNGEPSMLRDRAAALAGSRPVAYHRTAERFMAEVVGDDS
jgi:hypothetical protein